MPGACDDVNIANLTYQAVIKVSFWPTATVQNWLKF